MIEIIVIFIFITSCVLTAVSIILGINLVKMEYNVKLGSFDDFLLKFVVVVLLMLLIGAIILPRKGDNEPNPLENCIKAYKSNFKGSVE